MLSGLTVCLVKLITDVVAIACCVLRWFFLRRRQQSQSFNPLSHVLFALSIFCEIVATIQSSVVLISGDRVIAKVGVVEGAKFLGETWVLKTTFVAHLMYYCSECVLKAAYLVFYKDLYVRVHTGDNLKYAIPLATGVWAASYITAFAVLFTYCLPFEENWSPSGNNSHCPVLFNVPTFFILAGANIISDIAIFIVPLLILSELRLKGHEKVSLTIVFCIGTISIAASLIRGGIVGHRFITANHTWETVWVWMLLSHAEMFFGVVAFTLPAFRHVAKRCMKLNGKKRAGDSGKGGAEGMQYNRSPSSGWTDGSGSPRGNVSSVVQGTSTGESGMRRREDGVLVETTVMVHEELGECGDTDGDSFQTLTDAEKVCDPNRSQTELTSRHREG